MRCPCFHERRCSNPLPHVALKGLTGRYPETIWGFLENALCRFGVLEYRSATDHEELRARDEAGSIENMQLPELPR